MDLDQWSSVCSSCDTPSPTTSTVSPYHTTACDVVLVCCQMKINKMHFDTQHELQGKQFTKPSISSNSFYQHFPSPVFIFLNTWRNPFVVLCFLVEYIHEYNMNISKELNSIHIFQCFPPIYIVFG